MQGSTMNIKKICVLLALASTFALGAANAQESDDSSATEGAATDRQRPDREQQRPDREQQRQRRDNMTDEQRAAARERWEGMSDADRQTARDKRHKRRGSKDGKRGKGQRGSDQRGGERTPKTGTDAA